jgi:hypothetical protein
VTNRPLNRPLSTGCVVPGTVGAGVTPELAGVDADLVNKPAIIGRGASRCAVGMVLDAHSPAMLMQARRSARPPLPLRRQNEPLAVQPHGHVAFGGLAMASCAPCEGTQKLPLAR